MNTATMAASSYRSSKISMGISNHGAKTPSPHLISISTVKIGADLWHKDAPNRCSCIPSPVGQQNFPWISLSINGGTMGKPKRLCWVERIKEVHASGPVHPGGRKGNIPIFSFAAIDASSLLSVQINLRLNSWDGGSNKQRKPRHWSNCQIYACPHFPSDVPNMLLHGDWQW
jgi:hypothetical protein